MVAIAQAGIANHHQHTCYSLCSLVPALIVEWFLGCERELHLCDGHLELWLLFLLLRTPDTWSRRTPARLSLRIALHSIVLQCVGSQGLRTGYRIGSERVGQRLEGSEGVGLDLLGQRLRHPHLDLILVHHLILQRILLAVLGLRGERETLGLLAVLHFNDGIGRELQFLLEALRILRQLLLLVIGLLIGIELSGVGTVGNSLSACLLLFRLFLACLFLCLFLLLLFLLQLAGTLLLVEAFVGLLQERHHVIKLLEVERSVEVQRAVVVDDITKRRAVLEVGTTHPAISGVVRCVGIQPLEDGQQVQRQLVAGLERLAIVEWRAEVAQGVLHRIFPCIVAVWIEVFVDRRVGLFHLGMSGTLEVHVQILRQVPTQREVTVPEELLTERQRQLRTAEVLHVAFLQFVVVARDIGVECHVLRQPVQSEALQNLIPLRLRLDILERLKGFEHRRPRIVHAASPLVFVFIDSSLTHGVAMGVAIAEREVSRVDGCWVAFVLYAHPHIRE